MSVFGVRADIPGPPCYQALANCRVSAGFIVATTLQQRRNQNSIADKNRPFGQRAPPARYAGQAG